MDELGDYVCIAIRMLTAIVFHFMCSVCKIFTHTNWNFLRVIICYELFRTTRKIIVDDFLAI